MTLSFSEKTNVNKSPILGDCLKKSCDAFLKLANSYCYCPRISQNIYLKPWSSLRKYFSYFYKINVSYLKGKIYMLHGTTDYLY